MSATTLASCATGATALRITTSPSPKPKAPSVPTTPVIPSSHHQSSDDAASIPATSKTTNARGGSLSADGGSLSADGSSLSAAGFSLSVDSTATCNSSDSNSYNPSSGFVCAHSLSDSGKLPTSSYPR